MIMKDKISNGPSMGRRCSRLDSRLAGLDIRLAGLHIRFGALLALSFAAVAW